MSFLSQPITLIPIKPLRKIGNITVNVVINENTSDTLTITKQPVQQGSSITDHAYMEPTTLSMQMYFQANLSISLSELYKQLIDLQKSRQPFDIVTPKRIYTSMLLSVLGQTTDKNTENCLAINASFQEVIIVKISTVLVPKALQKTPKVTDATAKAGKKQSFLVKGKAIGKAIINGGGT